jgi:AraC-like DNA-binding protein
MAPDVAARRRPAPAGCGCSSRDHDPLPLPEFEHIVWTLLERHPCVRPSVLDVALSAGRTPRELRRSYERVSAVLGPLGRGNDMMPRRMLTYACCTYAADLIRRGTKVTAASSLAGFRHHGNFARQIRLYFGCNPSDLRGFCGPEQPVRQR